jgi:hypothetical protein
LYFYLGEDRWHVTQSKYLTNSPYDTMLDEWGPLIRKIVESEK